MISNISSEERGVVTLLPGAKHPFEDNDAVLLYGVQGMNLIKEKESAQS